MALFAAANSQSPSPLPLPIPHSSSRRTNTTTTTTTRMAALAGALTIFLLLLKKGRISKARLVEILAATLGGLLSSSCCTVQLVLNSLSMGCAGFAVLDTFRPFFLGVTFASLAYKTAMYDVRIHKNVWRSLPTWVIALVLAGSPTIVRRVNRWSGLGNSTQTGALLLDHAHTHAQTPVFVDSSSVLLQYRVEGMKCEACANALKNSLESLGEGVHADVLFDEGVVYVKEEGKATMALMGKEEAQAALERGIAEVMEERGYTSERVCVQQQQQQGQQETGN